MGVDFILFPLDTVKTRLQSKKGFIGSGGFRGIYSGLLSTMVGSAPTAALFFTIYETSKKKMANYSTNQTFNQIVAANLGEIVCSLYPFAPMANWAGFISIYINDFFDYEFKIIIYHNWSHMITVGHEKMAQNWSRVYIIMF